MKVERSDVMNGVKILSQILWRVGLLSDYRKTFWRMAIPALKRGDIESVIHAGLVGHHLIRFARDCAAGIGEYSFYSEKGAGVPVRRPVPAPLREPAPDTAATGLV
jgi:hopanoid C-2 methylase